MPSKPLEASPAMARLLRERRRELGLTLRDVQKLTQEGGKPIPHSTLARIESGRLDPGVRRLQQLLRLYRLPAQAAGDLLDLEAMAGAVPFERDPILRIPFTYHLRFGVRLIRARRLRLLFQILVGVVSSRLGSRLNVTHHGLRSSWA